MKNPYYLKPSKSRFPISMISKILGSTTFLLIISFGNQLAAQVFAPAIENPFQIVQNTPMSTPTLGDMDGDGDLDLLVSVYNNSADMVYYQNIGTTQSPVYDAPVINPFDIVPPSDITRPTLVDIDSDGDLDIFMWEFYNYQSKIMFMENIGTATAPQYAGRILNPQGIEWPGTISQTRPTFADIDNDGDLDMMLASTFDISVQMNVGTATAAQFDSPMNSPFGIDLGFVAGRAISTWVDIDNDGDYDILSLLEEGTFAIQENTGSPSVPQYAPVQENVFGLAPLNAETFSMTVGDLDADGDNDILTGEMDGPILFHENMGASVSTKRLIAQNMVELFPNPTSKVISIQTDLEIKSMEVYDILGRSVSKKEFNGNTIDVTALNKGSYILKFTTTENELIVKKFEKM